MRLAIALALLLAAPASADVLVPADPVQTQDAIGVSAAGDVLAFARPGGVTAFAGGQRIAIAGVGPGVAAAPDGTAALAALSKRWTLLARIRRPGHGFAQPVRLGGPAGIYALAAAPGGWAAFAWQRRDGHGIEAAVVDPAGAVRRAQLDHDGGRFSAPVVGIDAAGRATIAWTRYRRGERQHVRVAHGGLGWTRGREVGRGARAPTDPQWSQAGLAVTPAGHSLLAWAAPGGVRVSLDGAAPRTLAGARSPGPPSASLAEDGSAVVAYSASSQVFAVDRAQAGPWSEPHRLSGDPAHPPEGPPLTGPNASARNVVTATLGADGRALVAWATDGAAVATGWAGGAWTPAANVASPLRLVDWPPQVALDQTGGPFILWTEYEQSTLIDRIHGARLVPEAQAPPPDTKAPTLTTRLPESVEVAKSGAFAFSVPVACDEACDVRVDVADPDARPNWPGYDLRELSLPAGGQATVRLSPSPYDERSFVKQARPTRLRIVVEAADRAGNVATAEVTARVQRR